MSCDIINEDSVDVGALDMGPEDLPYGFEALSQTAAAVGNDDTPTLTVENVSLTLTESGDTAALRVQGELSGTGAGSEEEFRGVTEVDWTIDLRMQPEGQPAFENASVTGTVDFEVGPMGSSNYADINVNGAFGSQQVLSMIKPPGFVPWSETGTIDTQLSSPNLSSDRVGLHVRLYLDLRPEANDAFAGNTSAAFDITLTLSR